MIKLTADEFAAKVKKYSDKTVQLIAREVAGRAFTLLSTTILQTTPVLTGHARHNWVPSIDTPATGEIEGVSGAAVTGEALSGVEAGNLQQIVEQFIATDSARILYLTNNAPYIGALDAGSSAKAPAGIVQPSINATLELLRDTKLKV